MRVTVDVPLAAIPSVEVGQDALVTASGATTAEPGTVESISLLPTSSTSATYPVVVLVPAPTGALAPGAAAAVSIVLATADDVVAVPNSALTTLGTRTTVTVVKDGKNVLTPVETGAVGTTTTHITSGVTAGDELVLADLSASLPASSGELTTTRPGGAGGAGFSAGAGGFPPGAGGVGGPGGTPPGGR